MRNVCDPGFYLLDQIHRRIRHEVWRLQRRRIIPKFPANCLPGRRDAHDVYNERPGSPEGI